MTVPTDGVAPVEVRPGSRADRLAQPLTRDALKVLAESTGVCVRPLPFRSIDTATGVTTIVDIPCGARLASKCKPCAEKQRRLRRRQIREGWHLEQEPVVTPEPPADEVLELLSSRAHVEFDKHALMFEPMTPEHRVAQLRELDDASEQLDEALAQCRVRGSLATDKPTTARKARSTRRRQDAIDLPRLPVDKRTVGRVYRGRDGKTHRPSTLLTLTLGSHGDVHSVRRNGVRGCVCGTLHAEFDPLVGTPVDPDSYDYRRAALDAIHFARVLDRFWQNLRRAAGFNVQYAGAVELQKRLAPHAHFAVRGTIPRKLMKQVAAATYQQVWWPPFDVQRYTVAKPPVWDADQAAYLDPKTGHALPSWDVAVAALDDPDATPADVVRLGRVDARGIEAGTKDAERAVRYVTKYLTKDLVDDTGARGDAQQAHFDRLHAELSVLPCSPTCANWLLYGVQPDKAKAGLVPGRCSGKVHQRTTLGFTGRRVLVSRQWSGKTLADHRHDGRAWVRAVLSGQLADDPATGQADESGQAAANGHPGSADHSGQLPGSVRYELARPDDPDVPSLHTRVLRSISERQRWKAELDRARQAPGVVTTAPLPPPASMTLAA